MKAVHETEGDGGGEPLLCGGDDGTGCVGFIQGEVMYCEDEKSSAIRW